MSSSDREHIQHRLNFYHWCCMNRPEIVREWLRAIGKLSEPEPKKTVIRELIHTGSAHFESNAEFGPPIIAGEAESEPSYGIEGELELTKDGAAAFAEELAKATEQPPEAVEVKLKLSDRGKKLRDALSAVETPVEAESEQTIKELMKSGVSGVTLEKIVEKAKGSLEAEPEDEKKGE